MYFNKHSLAYSDAVNMWPDLESEFNALFILIRADQVEKHKYHFFSFLVLY